MHGVCEPVDIKHV